MKKFFRTTCIYNAGGLAAFAMVGIYLFIVWQLISSGSLIAQLLAVLWVIYFVCSAIAGVVILMIDIVRRIIAKKNESAPTEVSAE